MAILKHSDLLSQLASLKEAASKLPKDKDFSQKLRVLAEDFIRIAEAADTTTTPQLFDPAAPTQVGKFIAWTLLKQSRYGLLQVVEGTKFYGSGVYALYYRGSFAAYALISKLNVPLYVGKVDPGFPDAQVAREQGTKLWSRLNDHYRSISAAKSTLDVKDFDCRFLPVRSAWQNTAESYLIDVFKPVWNSEVGICFGIGKHGDSHETRGNARSPWDTVHEGRKWAWKPGNVPNSQSKEQIEELIKKHLKKVLPSIMEFLKTVES